MTANRDERGRFLEGTDPGPGRDSKYQDWMNDQAFRLALLGLTDEEIAQAFGICTATYYLWQEQHSGFLEAIQSGKTRADADVAHGLYKRAVGMNVVSERAFKDGKGEIVVAKTCTQLPPDVKAAAHWLGNRQRKRWGKEDGDPKVPGYEAGTGELTDTRNMSDEELEAQIEELNQRRQYEEKKG